ncbi:hypothetical protein V8E55_008196 [Tylopilus felleus]
MPATRMNRHSPDACDISQCVDRVGDHVHTRATMGPNGNEYFIRFNSLSYTNGSSPAEAFSAMFALAGMSGTFNGQSTAPLVGRRPTLPRRHLEHRPLACPPHLPALPPPSCLGRSRRYRHRRYCPLITVNIWFCRVFLVSTIGAQSTWFSLCFGFGGLVN